MSDKRPDKSAFGEDRDAGAPFVIGSAELGVDLSALRNVVKHLGATELEAFTEPDECDYFASAIGTRWVGTEGE